MRVLLSWLREFTPVELGPDALAELLTSKGAKVEAVERPWEGLRGVVVARVLEVRDHPGSDRLCVASVDAGRGPVEVVVGVRNMGPGDLVPYAPPGARLPGQAEPLGRREIRGVASEGMLCSPRELGVSQDHSGILVLPPDAPPGTDVASLLGLDDVVLDLEVKSNRPDLLSVAGVAREVAAALALPFRTPGAVVPEGEERAADAATVEILDLERCPRYVARVIKGVQVGPSPLRVQARLTALGQRPISNVVDATNYVMLELGQPLHAFDLAQLKGPGIVVRRAAAGERLVTLDDVERELTDDDLLICDLERPVALAGVIGGKGSEVSEATRDVLLESAAFERPGIARTSRRLGVATEASYRFSRGVDPEGCGRAADRAAGLIAAWGGGTVLAGWVEAGAAPPRRRVRIRPARAQAVLGVPQTPTSVREALERIWLRVDETEGALVAEVPGFRPDLELEEDLIEEVIRVQGYDRVGETLPAVRQAGGIPPERRLRDRIRRAMVRAGLFETQAYSFAGPHDLALLGQGEADAIRIANPLSADQRFLRTSLLPGLLAALRTNRARQVRGAALFEVGRTFHPGEPVREIERVALALWGEASRGFPEPPRSFDVLDAKGALEVLFEALGIDDHSLGDPPGVPFHPTRSAVVLVGGEVAGVLGELHPREAERLDLEGRVALAELEVEILGRHAATTVVARELPRFPPVRRDLAFLVDERTPAAAVRAALLEAGEGLVEACVLFDVFSGRPIPEGRKSLAFSVDLRAPDRTLTDEEADALVARIVERLARDLGAELRGG